MQIFMLTKKQKHFHSQFKENLKDWDLKRDMPLHNVPMLDVENQND